MDLEGKVKDALRDVIDPETGLDVMVMRLVRDLQVREDGRVKLTFRPSSVICPLGFQLGIDIKEAVQRVEGVNGVDMVVDGFIHADRLMNILKQMD
jgi:metal-sulfur cluster biosynthetic enzyme